MGCNCKKQVNPRKWKRHGGLKKIKKPNLKSQNKTQY